MDVVGSPKIPHNVIDRCRDLWTLQKKLKELLSQYGTCLDTLAINPHHEEARSTMLCLVDEIHGVGRTQNILLKEWVGSIVQLSENYSTHKSFLLENFRDAFIRQLWCNGMEQCSGEVDEDIVKILYLNQMNLIPTGLEKCLNSAGEMVSKSIDVGNIRVNSLGSDDNVSHQDSSITALEKVPQSYEKHVLEMEPRCTRSSKILLKRNTKDEAVNIKSRRKMPALSKVPNTCCSLCKKLIHVTEDLGPDSGKEVICCINCNEKFYSSSTSSSSCLLVTMNGKEEEADSVSEVSSPNDTSQDTSHSNHS